MGWDQRYRRLEEGEIIRATDEIMRDDGTWEVARHAIGQPAPDPCYTSHRTYRRMKAPPMTPTEIEQAQPGDERRVLEALATQLFEFSSAFYWPRFMGLLDAAAYLDAAMMLVPEGWHIEIKGPRKYLNIPSPVPNYWSANVETWSHEGQKMGWGPTPALALCAAIARAGGE